MAVPAGYSATPLVQKLGIKPNESIWTINAPEHYTKLLHPLPEGVTFLTHTKGEVGFIHYFVISSADLHIKLILLKKMLKPNGTLWVSWPKKTSAKALKLTSDIDENLIRKEAIAIGLVDVKVCAIDDVWSGLKLVIPVKNRQ